MKFYFISKACKGHEYLYKREFVTKCRSKKQAEEIATFLNNRNGGDLGKFELAENETWHAYEDDDFFVVPYYKISVARNGHIKIKINN